VYVPSWTPTATIASSGTIAVDHKERALAIDEAGHARITFDLDVPATIALRFDDGAGAWWTVQRSITADRISRPGDPSLEPVSLLGDTLFLGRRRIALPEVRPWIAAAWVEKGTLAFGIIGSKGTSSWRLRVRDQTGSVLAELRGEEDLADVVRVPLTDRMNDGERLSVQLEAQSKDGQRVIGPLLVLNEDLALGEPAQRTLSRSLRLHRGREIAQGERIVSSALVIEIGAAPGPIVLVPLY
jgi:hypothetical protein